MTISKTAREGGDTDQNPVDKLASSLLDMFRAQDLRNTELGYTLKNDLPEPSGVGAMEYVTAFINKAAETGRLTDSDFWDELRKNNLNRAGEIIALQNSVSA